MGLKKRSKVNAQFNMSSLTDIIFLLLIFFMLTSSLVAPNALNLKLPGMPGSSPTPKERIDQVRIDNTGGFYLNNRRIAFEELDQQLRRQAAGSREKVNITIAPDQGTPVEFVVQVMNLAMKYDINGILATEK